MVRLEKPEIETILRAPLKTQKGVSISLSFIHHVVDG